MKKYSIGNGVRFNSNIQEKLITPVFQKEYSKVKKTHNQLNIADQERNRLETIRNPIHRQINAMNYNLGTVSKNFNNQGIKRVNPIPYDIRREVVHMGGIKPVRKTVKPVRKTVKPVRKTVKK